MSNFLAALVGALVGGLATFGASWWQTRQVLQHETQKVRIAAEEERKAAREGLSRAAAYQLLTVLAKLDEVLPGVGQDGRLPERQQVRAALDLMQHAQVAQLPVVPTLAKRWGHLRVLVAEVDDAPRSVVDEARYPTDWTPQKIGRARDDVKEYAEYVRRSVVAVIDGNSPPDETRMPVLRRLDMAVWQPPDAGTHESGPADT